MLYATSLLSFYTHENYSEFFKTLLLNKKSLLLYLFFIRLTSFIMHVYLINNEGSNKMEYKTQSDSKSIALILSGSIGIGLKAAKHLLELGTDTLFWQFRYET